MENINNENQKENQILLDEINSENFNYAQTNFIEGKNPSFIEDFTEISEDNQNNCNINTNFNTNNNNNNSINGEIELLNPKNSLNTSLGTNATLNEDVQCLGGDLSFCTFDNNGNKKQKKKNLTPESIGVLEKFLKEEKEILIEKYNNSFPLLNKINANKNIGNGSYKEVKEIKNNLNQIEGLIELFFKRPFMKKKINEKNKQKEKIFFKDDEKKININKILDEDKFEEKIKITKKISNSININTNYKNRNINNDKENSIDEETGKIDTEEKTKKEIEIKEKE